MKEISNKNIVYIKNNNNFNNKIDKNAKVSINKNKINLLYIVSKDIILYARELL